MGISVRCPPWYWYTEEQNICQLNSGQGNSHSHNADGLFSDSNAVNKSDIILTFSGADLLIASMSDFLTFFVSVVEMGKLNSWLISTSSLRATLTRVSIDQFFLPHSIPRPIAHQDRPGSTIPRQECHVGKDPGRGISVL